MVRYKLAEVFKRDSKDRSVIAFTLGVEVTQNGNREKISMDVCCNFTNGMSKEKIFRRMRREAKRSRDNSVCSLDMTR
jgi:hypothetical protein